MYTEIKKCRICGNSNLVSVMNLGVHYMTGVFPKAKDETLTKGPLELVKCHGDGCGLLQLKQSYDPSEMYGMNYGYRSNLNASMVGHLTEIVTYVKSRIHLGKGDVVVDIGSNDGTTLIQYPKECELIGIDPTGVKFAKYYPKHIKLIPKFFSSKLLGKKKAKVVTSIAMFYDLESPVAFMQEVKDILHEDGIWVMEQNYLPTMLANTAYDMIGHEHLEYYGIKQITWMAKRCGLKILDISFNDTNGGSVLITLAKEGSRLKANTTAIFSANCFEKYSKLDDLRTYATFKRNILAHKHSIRYVLNTLRHHNSVVAGYGASTRGNMILQLCEITNRDLVFMAEVNKDKFGCVTPGTWIPIVSEENVKRLRPDVYLVMPWHFREGIIRREADFLAKGGKLLFPLPQLEMVSK